MMNETPTSRIQASMIVLFDDQDRAAIEACITWADRNGAGGIGGDSLVAMRVGMAELGGGPPLHDIARADLLRFARNAATWAPGQGVPDVVMRAASASAVLVAAIDARRSEMRTDRVSLFERLLHSLTEEQFVNWLPMLSAQQKDLLRQAMGVSLDQEGIAGE
jgi:hypothetical protein